MKLLFDETNDSEESETIKEGENDNNRFEDVPSGAPPDSDSQFVIIY